jgi:uncharacterized protein (DUF2147 family)
MTLKRLKSDSSHTAKTQANILHSVKQSTEKGFTGSSMDWFDGKFFKEFELN